MPCKRRSCVPLTAYHRDLLPGQSASSNRSNGVTCADAGPGSATAAAAAAADTFDLGPDDGSSPCAAAVRVPSLSGLGQAALGNSARDGSGQGIALVVDAQVHHNVRQG